MECAWATAQANTAKWLKQLERERLSNMVSAMQSNLRQQADTYSGTDVREEDIAKLETLRGRMHWLTTTFGSEDLSRDIAEVCARLQRLSTQAKVAKGLRLLVGLTPEKAASLEGLQAIREAFEDCRGMSVEPTAVPHTVNGARRIAKLPLLSSDACDLAEALLSLAPEEAAEGAVAEEVAKEVSLWKRRYARTAAALRVIELAGKEGSDLPGDIVQLAGARAALAAWQRSDASVACMPDSLSDEAQKAASNLEQQLDERGRAQVTSARDAMLVTLPQLETIARGKTGGGAWKEHLADDSPWSDVLREVTYHLLSTDAGGQQYSERVATLFSELSASWDKCLEARKDARACSRKSGNPQEEVEHQELTKRRDAAIAIARVTSCEIYLVEMPTTARKDKAEPKLKARIASMTKKGIDPAEMHPAIWAKVQDAVG